MDGKIIKNIKPYNDIFYNNCFFNSFFPVVEHFERDILHFMVNDVIVYSDNTKNNIPDINIDYVAVKPINILLDEVGLSLNRKIESEDIVEDILTFVEKDIPVIIWVDCFYESIRNDTYLKQHWPHSWLIFGFSRKEKVFHIIEHSHREYLTYDKRIVSFEETMNCYNGFLSNFQKEYGIESFFAFSLQENYAESEGNVERRYSTTFLNNMYEKKYQVLVGLDYLRSFIDYMKQILKEREQFLCNVGSFVNLLNNIVKAKQVEKYRLLKLFPEDIKKTEQIEEVIKNWNFARGIFAKIMFSSVIRDGPLVSLESKFEQIYSLECKYYNSFY